MDVTPKVSSRELPVINWFCHRLLPSLNLVQCMVNAAPGYGSQPPCEELTVFRCSFSRPPRSMLAKRRLLHLRGDTSRSPCEWMEAGRVKHWRRATTSSRLSSTFDTSIIAFHGGSSWRPCVRALPMRNQVYVEGSGPGGRLCSLRASYSCLSDFRSTPPNKTRVATRTGKL